MRLYGPWKVTLPGEEYLWEPDEMDGPECYAVEQELVGTPWETFEAWAGGVGSGLWVPCQTLVWFLRHKAGQPSERRDVTFKLRQLDVIQAPKAEEGDEPSETDGSPPSPDSGSAPVTSTS